MNFTQNRFDEPIALVGIACEFAGAIHSPVEFWEALVGSIDLSSEIPTERMDFESYMAHMLNQDDGDLNRKLIRRGYYVPTSLLDTFEPSFFGLSDGESATIDPCHRLLMLKFIHLLDDAGYSLDKMRGSRTSVHIGQFSNEHCTASLRLKPEHRTRFHGCNTLLYNASARLSYHFDLRGPNLSLDGACSSSLQALHLAVQTLRSGEADMAVCGGVNAVYTPEALHEGSLLGAISPEGRCRVFSIDANGYARSDGLGLVLLKRLSDAERDRDRIYCVLREVLANHDGCEDKNSYVVPSAAGQQRLLADTYGRAQYDPRCIIYVEAHGTGTPAGDPIEANTLGQFFNRSPFDPPLLIGSVKSNIGHTEGAAGVAGLIKVAMCMRHRAIPPNMHFTALNPKIDAQRYNLHIVQNMVLFPPIQYGQVPISIGINSFGMGGNNVHAIVEEYRWPRQSVMTNGHTDAERLQQHYLFVFSTKSPESLHRQVAQFKAWFQGQVITEDHELSFLARISQQLLLKRTISHKHLAIFVSAGLAQLQQQIEAFLAKQTSLGVIMTMRSPVFTNNLRICFVFSGQGPQWWAMGRQLYRSEPVFRRWIERIDAELTKVNNGEWHLLDELIQASEQESRINDTNIAQPALFAVQVALASLLISWCIFPSAIVSHSAGEQAAAFVAGRVTLNEAVRIVYHRSRLQHRNTRQGGQMLAVSMSEKEAHKSLLRDIEHLVSIAVVNSPRSVTLSGETITIDELEQILTAFHPNVFKARLRIENAFHSHQMDRFSIKEEMLSTLRDIRGVPLANNSQMFDVSCAKAPLYSSVTGGQVDDLTPLNAQYWWSNVRQCVRFGDAIQTIVSDNVVDAFLELSPHPVLATSIRECCEVTNYQPLILPTLKRKEDEQTTLLTSLAQLTHSSDVWQHYLDSRAIQPTGGIDEDQQFEMFPLYAFNTMPCWYESKESVLERLAYRIPLHPLLGVRQWNAQQTSAIWKSLINLNLPQHAYLKDHRIQDSIIFPATGYIELALAACRQLMLPATSNNEQQQPIVFEKVEFIKALFLTEHELTEIFTQVIMPMREWIIYSRPWSMAGPDCIRSSGMACTDVLDSFIDLQSLNSHALSQFTIHARGRIDMSSNVNAKALSIPSSPATFLNREKSLCCCSLFHDPVSFYAYLFDRGYQYGSRFQLVTSMEASRSKIVGQVIVEQLSDLDRYHLHPVVLDSCCHPYVLLLPGNETFLPANIDKVIIYGRTTHASHLTTYGTYQPTVIGVSQERAYTADWTVCDEDEKPLVVFESFKSQPIADRCSSKKSVFDKVNELANLPNSDLTPHIEMILTEYCLEKKWSEETTSIKTMHSFVDMLPSPNTLLEQVERLREIKSNDDGEIDRQLEQSVEELNTLTAKYMVIAFKYLASFGDETHEQQQQLVECEFQRYVRQDEPYYGRLIHAARSLVIHQQKLGLIQEDINAHSIQLARKRLLEKFPLLRPLLAALAKIGSPLGQILSGEQDIIDLFLEQSDEQALKEMQTLLSTTQVQLAFQALIACIKEQTCHTTDCRRRRLRVLVIGGDSSSIALLILDQLIKFAQETEDDVLVELVYTDMTSTLLNNAEKTLKSALQDHGDRVRMEYRVLDLMKDDEKETGQQPEDIAVESMHDIVFTANQLHLLTDRVWSMDRLQGLLAPGGLLIFVELTRTHSYFDLLFGPFDYWWRADNSNNGRALLTADQWSEVVRGTGGFESIVSTRPNLFGHSIIIAQKFHTMFLSTVHHDVKKYEHDAWLLLADRNHGLCHALAPLLQSSNVIMLFDESEMVSIRLKIESMLKQCEQLHVVFAWSLDSETHELGDHLENINEAIFKWQEEHLCGQFVFILQAIQSVIACGITCSPHPYVYVLTQNVQRNAIEFQISSTPLLGLARSLSVEYARHHIKLIDLQPATATTVTDTSVRFSFHVYSLLITCEMYLTSKHIVYD